MICSATILMGRNGEPEQARIQERAAPPGIGPFRMHRMNESTGIEPVYAAFQTAALPLSYNPTANP